MHSLATFARNNSVGWMFLTVILGAMFILSGWLPLQFVGTVMIALGVVMPISQTSLPPWQHQESGTQRNAKSHLSPSNSFPSQSTQKDGVDYDAVEQQNIALREELVSAYGTRTLLDDKLKDDINQYFVRHNSAETVGSTSSDIELLWQQTINGTDIQSIADNLGIVTEYALIVQQQALYAAIVSPLLHTIRQQRAS